MKVLSTAALILSVAVSSGAQAPTLDQLVAKLDQAGRSFRSMEANIERTKVTVLVNDKSTDYGKVYASRQNGTNSWKIEFTSPSPQSLLLDKGKALLYYPKIKQAQEYSLGQNADRGASFVFPGFGQTGAEMREDYNMAVLGTEMIDGQNTTKLELKPKSPKYAAQFPSIVLWLDPQRFVPVQVRHNEASGDYQIAKFTNIKLNSGVPGSVFTLKLPKDVNVSKGSF